MIYGRMVAFFCSLVANLDVTAAVFTNKVERLSHYLVVRGVPHEQRSVFLDYLDHLWKRQRGTESRARRLLDRRTCAHEIV